MNIKMPATLFTAIGVFQAATNWIIEVAVPNFPTREDAEAYAPAFRIKFNNGRLYRDDGKGVDVFDDSWREVLDSQITLSLMKPPGQDHELVILPIEQWHSMPGLLGDFQPVDWRVEQDRI